MTKYLARITDGAILKQNEDGTYSFIDTGMFIPYKYSKDMLNYPMFEEVTEKDFPYLKERGEEYHAYSNWASRSNGHGGCKGGTIEEFRRLKNTK